MTKNQEQVLRDRVLRCWPSTFSSSALNIADDYDPKRPKSIWVPNSRDKRKVLDAMLAEGTIELVSLGTPDTSVRPGVTRSYRVVDPGIWGGDEVLCHDARCTDPIPHRGTASHRLVLTLRAETGTTL